MNVPQPLTPGLVRLPAIQPDGGNALALTPGQLLNVTVHQNSQGQRGVLVGGTFVQAELPQSLRDGEKLTVQVIQTTGTVVLRVLSNEPSAGAPKGTIVTDLLRALLRQTDLSAPQLRDTITNTEPPLSQSLLVLKERLKNVDTPLGRAVGQALDALLRQHPIVTETELKQPELLRSFIERALLPGVARGTAEAAASLRELAARGPELARAQADAGLARALLAFLTATNDTPTATTTPRLELMLAATHYAVATGDKNLMAQILSRPDSTASAKNTGFEALLASLTPLAFQSSDRDSAEPNPLREIIQNLVRELTNLKNARADPEQRKGPLATAKAALAELIASQEGRWSADQQAHEGLEVAKTLERLLRTSEALNTLAPLVRATQEPVLHTIPLIIGNLLGTLRLSVTPKRVNRDAPESESGSPTPEQNFTQLELDLTLEKLGPIHVHIAQRENQEILVRFDTPAADHAATISGALPKLNESLKGLGFEQIKLNARQAATTPHTPSWLVELSQRQEIA